jgi:hypothetical protein
MDLLAPDSIIFTVSCKSGRPYIPDTVHISQDCTEGCSFHDRIVEAFGQHMNFLKISGIDPSVRQLSMVLMTM